MLNKKPSANSKKNKIPFDKIFLAFILLSLGANIVGYVYDLITRPKIMSIAEVDGNITFYVSDPPQSNNRFIPDESFISVVNSQGEKLGILDIHDTDLSPYLPMNWSPDGKRLAITDFGDCLLIIEETSANCLIEQGIFSSWAPDGQKLAFSIRSQNQERSTLLYINLITNEQTKIIDAPITIYVGSSWSPNSQQLVYEETNSRGLWLYSLQNARSRFLTRGHDPAWSPDDKVIAFVRGGQLWLYDLSDSSETLLVDSFSDITQPIWSPDNTALLFVGRPDNMDTNEDIYIIQHDGSGLRNLSNLPGQEYAPTWHPGFSD